MCSWGLGLMFKAKLKLQSGNWKIQYGYQVAILKVTLLKIIRLLPIYRINLLQKFGLDIQSQTWSQNPETEKSNMAARQPFWKWHCWKSTGFFPYTQVICYWSLDLIFNAKLKLEPGNWKIQYGRQTVILKVTQLKINRLWSIATNNMHMKFEIEIPKQSWVTLQKPCQLQSPDTEKSNMATRRSFWKWHCWKSIDFFPYTQVMCQWSLDPIFKAKLKLGSGNRKIQYGRQAAILKVTSLKINRFLSIATSNMHMKFEIKIAKQSWVTLRKPCRLQTDGQTGRQTDRQASWTPQWIAVSQRLMSIFVYPMDSWVHTGTLMILSLRARDRQTDGQTDGQTDRQTDGQGESNITPTNFVGRGYN